MGVQECVCVSEREKMRRWSRRHTPTVPDQSGLFKVTIEKSKLRFWKPCGGKIGRRLSLYDVVRVSNTVTAISKALACLKVCWVSGLLPPPAYYYVRGEVAGGVFY